MSKALKIGGLVVLGVAVLAGALIMATGALAQEPVDPTPDPDSFPFGRGGFFGPGGMMGGRDGGFGRGGMMGGGFGVTIEAHAEVSEALAEALGLSVEELEAEMALGKPLWQIAEEQGVDAEAVQQAMEDARAAAIAQAVEDGELTQEQADALLENSGPGFVGPGGFGPGMMGGGFGVRIEAHAEVSEALAEALGLSVEELEAEMALGKPLWQIAEEQGVDAEAVQQAMEEAHDAMLAQAVADGILTQEQADLMDEHMEQMGFGHMSGPDGTFPGGCPGSGGRGGFGPGMMGGFGN
jgi:hypothetical protein